MKSDDAGARHSSGEPAASFEITQETRVSWFDLRQLCGTAAKTAAATIIGSMSGRRELMAALDPEPTFFDYADGETIGEIWLDYIADTGDGWNATCSIAWLAGRDALGLKSDGQPMPQPTSGDCRSESTAGELQAGGADLVLPGGSILILGGDQVYPTASPETYRDRFEGPFRCARYSGEKARKMFAIPGNHDWYDGLTTFIRLFCQKAGARRWVGVWQAQQRRSYFALKLPHGWWLWGVDMALEDDLDPSQYDYFRAVRKEILPDERVILCVPAPVWLDHNASPDDAHTSVTTGSRPAYVSAATRQEAAKQDAAKPLARVAEKLDIIIDLIAGDGEVAIPVVLSGDLHYYARHFAETESLQRHYIVSGGGGAFGLGTLHVPEQASVPNRNGDLVVAERKVVFPDECASKRLRKGVLSFPLTNRAFTIALVGVMLFVLSLLGAYQRGQTIDPGRCSVRLWNPDSLDGAGWMARSMCEAFTWGNFIRAVLEPAGLFFVLPSLMITMTLVLAAFAGFANAGKRRHGRALPAILAGLLHGVVQTSGAMAIFWLSAQLFGGLAYQWSGGGYMLVDMFGDVAIQWVSVGLGAALIWIYSGMVFGFYLLASHVLLGMHDQEVFSAQGIEDYKNFLRIHVTKDAVTIYPIGLRRTAKIWRPAPGVREVRIRAAWFGARRRVLHTPQNCQRVMDPVEPLAPHLIEPPIVIARSGR